jgi:2-haloacid dehalogenase
MALEEIRALTFDAFGTVVDWRTSVAREAAIVGNDAGVSADWPAISERWPAGYQPSMARVRSGDLPWTNFDDLHAIPPGDAIGPWHLRVHQSAPG